MALIERPIVVLCLALAVLVCPLKSAPALKLTEGQDIYVDIPSPLGRVLGKSFPSQYHLLPDRWVNVFLGIPYAKRLEQFGDEWRTKYRFVSPEDPYWYETWDATYMRPACPQMPWLIRETIPNFSDTAEDCLFLNIYTPRRRGETSNTVLYPVMVYFPGGGFIMGSGHQYPGYFLAERNIIVVTVNYRLNALGFLSTGDRYSAGNYGMFDQVKALEFVKRYIVYFRGDVNRITIMGQSSGAASVGLHLVSPRSENLFTQAIMLSGSDLSEWAVIPKADSIEYSQRLAYEVGCPTSDTQRLIDCLRYSRSFNEIVNASARISMLPGKVGNPWGPVVDGQIVGIERSFLPDPPLDLRNQNRMKKIKILAGMNLDDGAYFIPNLPNLIDGVTPAQFDNILREFLQYRGIEDYTNVFSALQFQYTYWPVTRNATYTRQELIEMMSDYVFGSGMNAVLEYQVRHNTVYFYVFRYRSWYAYSPPFRGVCHGEDLQYVFGLPFINNTYINLTGIYPRQEYDFADRNISEYMISMITNFTARGDPTPRDQPIIWFRNSSWLEYNMVNHSYLSISNKSENLVNYRQPEYGFWREYFPQISGRGYYLTTKEVDKPSTASTYEMLTYALAAISALLCAIVIIMCVVLIRKSTVKKY